MTTGLFTPIKLGPYTLPNRIVMAPMTRCRIAVNGAPDQLNELYYSQRASAGLIITEACAISPQAVGYANTPGIYTNKQIEGWRNITKNIHKKNGHIFLQLWHVGRISHPSLQIENNLPVAPSAIRPAGNASTYDGPQTFVTPRALKQNEISSIINDYRKAASNAIDAGFDGVEIHAANGYLIDQFLRSSTNCREDNYGGSIENRTRFLLEVTNAIAKDLGASRVGLRLSPLNSFNDIYDSDPQTLFEFVIKQLNSLGLAYLHIVEGVIHAKNNTGQQFDYKQLATQYQGNYMANNGYNKTTAENTIASGSADLISFGVPYIANPDLVEQFAQNKILNEADPATFYTGGENGYITYS